VIETAHKQAARWTTVLRLAAAAVLAVGALRIVESIVYAVAGIPILERSGWAPGATLPFSFMVIDTGTSITAGGLAGGLVAIVVRHRPTLVATGILALVMLLAWLESGAYWSKYDVAQHLLKVVAAPLGTVLIETCERRLSKRRA
jgi:hypothetical protein